MGIIDDLYVDQRKVQPDVQHRKDNWEWVNDSFFTPRSKMSTEAKAWTFYSPTDNKFTDSSWGGNFSINARQQWTPLSDPRRYGMLAGRHSGFHKNTNPLLNITNLGMGRMYGEQVDDQAQRVYFRFGVPMYNNLTDFMQTMTNSDMVRFAQTGSSSNFAEILGGVLAGGFLLMMKPWLGIIAIFANLFRTFITNKIWTGGNAFYALKSVQHQYWSGVQSMVNEFLVQSDFVRFDSTINKVTGLDEERDKRTRNQVEPGNNLHEDVFKFLQRGLPDIFNENGGFNVMELVNKTARRSNAYMSKLQARLDRDGPNTNGAGESYSNMMMRVLRERASGKGDTSAISDVFVEADHTYEAPTEVRNAALASKVGPAAPLLLPLIWAAASLNNWYNKEAEIRAKTTGETPIVVTGLTADPATDPSVSLSTQAALAQDSRRLTLDDPNISPEYLSSLQDNITTNLDVLLGAGAEFVAFDVSYTGSVQDGVTNSVTPSSLSEGFNAIASTGRGFKYSTANGNIGGGAIGELLQSGVGLVAGVLKGALNWVTADIGGNILDALGGANIDIPMFWDSSTVQLPTANYTIQLRAGGGDIISLLKGIYLPLFCIMNGAFPQSTGGSSHANPLYCQVYDKGRLQKNLAMITGLTITRGAGNLGFNERGMALGIDVTIEVTDLSPILTIPTYGGMLEPGEPMSAYLQTLAAVTIDAQLYGTTRLAKTMERYSRRLDTLTSAGYASNAIAQGIKGSVFNRLYNPRYAFGLMSDAQVAGVQNTR